MTKLIIRNTATACSKDIVIETDDVRKTLFERFKSWPKTAVLYRKIVSTKSVIPLETKQDVENLQHIEDDIYCVLYPAGIVAAGAAIFAAGGIAALYGPGRMKHPSFDISKDKPVPNNGLVERTNEHRLGSRIPDIYGTVISTPDLITVPYRVFENGFEVEYMYTCVGRGEHVISQVKDGKSLISSIEGASAEVYDPFTSPNYGTASQVIGDPITEPLRCVRNVKEVNGQVLPPENAGPVGTEPSIGWIYLDASDWIYLNFSMESVAYGRLVDGTVTGGGSDIYIEIDEVDDMNVPAGTETLHPAAISSYYDGGNSPVKTVKIENTYGTRVRIGVKRVPIERVTIPQDDGMGGYTYEEQYDDLNWDDCFLVDNVEPDHFGDVTTIYTRTVYNKKSAAIEERKLNCVASRVIPILNAAGTAIESYSTSSKVAEIAAAIAIDPYIGNRNIADVDIVNFRAAQSAVETYFGSVKAGEFNYTFDDSDISFEEMISSVADAAFCNVYRYGSQLKFFFEQATENSSLLFNHRNKLPGTETRSVSFGMNDEYDGVEVKFMDDESMEQYILLPTNGSAVNPDSVTLIGVTNLLQARFHAYRIYNRLIWERLTVEFEATQEADLLNLNERVEIADNTRSDCFDGELVDKSGLTLTLSQPFEFESGKSYTIFLQNTDGTIKSKTISAGPESNQVVLNNDTDLDLTFDPTFYAKTVYEIVDNSSPRVRAFLVREKDPRDNFTSSIVAVNYDSRYYANDQDFNLGVVDEDGNII